MQREDLLKIKDDVVKSIEPLILENSTDPESKFQLLIKIIRSSDEGNILSLYKQAYGCALTIDDPQVKLDSLSELLDEIEIGLNVLDNTSASMEDESDDESLDDKENDNNSQDQQQNQ